MTQMKRARISWLLSSSSFAYCFGLMSREKLYQRFDRAAELYGRGPAFFSGYSARKE
jgi:hypothetical protein